MLNESAFGPRKVTLPPVAETLERLRLTARIGHQEWFDVLGLHWRQYHRIKAGTDAISDDAVERVARYFQVDPEDVLRGRLDFGEIASIFVDGSPLPERYTKAAHGRRRTSITSVDFIEKAYGWRLRLDTLAELGVSEAALRDPFAPISMHLISDMCAYLHNHRHFRPEDFHAMGAYSYSANRGTLIGRVLSEMRSPAELYEFFFGEAMKLFERNCSYTITRLNDKGLIFEVLTNPDVAADSGVRHLGNVHVCRLKGGTIANTARYIGLPSAKVRETACVHRGDSVCRFELDFSPFEQKQFNPLASLVLH